MFVQMTVRPCKVNISLPDGRTIVRWRRFMRVPAPPPNSTVEPVQLDHARAGLLVASQPFLGRGYYMQGGYGASVNMTVANSINISVSPGRMEFPPVLFF